MRWLNCLSRSSQFVQYLWWAETSRTKSNGGGTMMIVVFIKDGIEVTKRFDSVYRCRKFIERAKRSKKITLVRYPYFRE